MKKDDPEDGSDSELIDQIHGDLPELGHDEAVIHPHPDRSRNTEENRDSHLEDVAHFGDLEAADLELLLTRYGIEAEEPVRVLPLKGGGRQFTAAVQDHDIFDTVNLFIAVGNGLDVDEVPADELVFARPCYGKGYGLGFALELQIHGGAETVTYKEDIDHGQHR